MENVSDLNRLKFPIGHFEKKESYSSDELNKLIIINESAPAKYRKIVESLKPEDLNKTYREGSWTIQQLIHHVADIQLLHFLRMKKALTEPNYKEVTLIDMDGWAGTADGTKAPVEDSLMMFEGINKRYVFLLRSLDDATLKIQYYHPVRKFTINQAQAIAMSAWHVDHHLAHIKIALGESL
ncbi:DinB family protein [Echinicola marina]|uniref:YfiT family bacillithiol transferase n=1 Tax=Echinicola marina TaxID=2859768 RepID=UPI001CF65653|nr:DinB family protein [Echinicola marina]UCS93870.1 DinB family protein [Echinicola marina]